MRAQVLLLALIACKRDPGGNGAFGALPDALVTITEEGAGPEVDGALLQPTGPGYRAQSQPWDFPYLSGWVRWPGAVDAGRDDVFPMEYGGFRPGVQVYRWTDDGLVVHAFDQPLEEATIPVLMVPEKVRVGMAWESDLGDGMIIRSVVQRHETVMLPIGPTDVWAIGAEFEAGTVAVTRWYAEGVGRIDWEGQGDEPYWSYGFSEMVAPVDLQEHAELALDPVSLADLGLPSQDWANYNFHVLHLSGAVIDGKLWGYVDGLLVSWEPYAADIPLDLCLDLSAGLRVGDASTDPACASRSVIVTDSPYPESAQIDNAAEILPGADVILDLDGGGAAAEVAANSAPVTLSGWVVDGVVRTLTHAMSGLPPAQFYQTALDPVTPAYTALADRTGPRGVFLGGRQDDPMGLGGAWSALVGQTWIGPAAVAPDATVHLAVVGLDGQVFRATLADGAVSGFVPTGVLPGAVSIVLDGDERIAISITKDGRVFQLRVDQGTGDVAIHALGSVRVVDDGIYHDFMGAVVDPTHPGDVIVATVDYPWVDGIIQGYDEGGGFPAGPVGLYPGGAVPLWGTARVYRGHLDAEPFPVVSAASLNVGAAEIDAGIAVCWAPSDEPFTDEGWTLRGEPVEVVGPVGPDGNCAIVPFERTAPADPNWIGSERAIEAVIPGAGQVRLGFPAGRHVGYTLDPRAAVLPDGSIVDVTGLVLDRHGFPVSKTTTGMSSGSYSTAWARDLGGYGFWTWWTSPTAALELRNIGGGGVAAPPCPDTQSVYRCSFGGVVVEGGVLYVAPPGQLPAQILAVRPDGTVDDVPAAQVDVAYNLGSRVLLADGRICGLAGYPYHLDCVNPEGVTETAGPLPTLGGDWWPLSDGSLILAGDGALRFDPATKTLALLDARMISGAITSEDGHVYAIAYVSGNTASLVEITPDAVIDIATVAAYSSVVPIDGALLVTSSQDGLHLVGWTRIPR